MIGLIIDLVWLNRLFEWLWVIRPETVVGVD